MVIVAGSAAASSATIARESDRVVRLALAIDLAPASVLHVGAQRRVYEDDRAIVAIRLTVLQPHVVGPPPPLPKIEPLAAFLRLGAGVAFGRYLGGFAELDHDDVAVVLTDDALDPWHRVPWPEDELGRGGANGLVLRNGQIHAIDAHLVAALAEELLVASARVLRPEALLERARPLVDLAEDRLVPRQPFLARGHGLQL